MSKVNVSAIICYTTIKNNLPLLENCLISIKNAAKQQVNLKILVNVETDGQPNFGKLNKHINDVLIAKPKSFYTSRHNKSIDYCIKKHKPDYILLINDDAWVNKKIFQELNKCIDNSPEVIIPMIFRPDNKNLDSFGVEYFQSGYSKNNVFKNTPTQLASASCVLISASGLKKIKKLYGNYFTEIFGWYIEDVELFLRLRIIGAKFIKNPKMIANHIGSSTWGINSYFPSFHGARNTLWTIIINWPKKLIIRNIFNILLIQFWVFLFNTYKHGPGLYFRVLKETMQNFRQLTEIRKRYSKISSTSTFFNRRNKNIFSPVSFRTKQKIIVPGF